MGNIKSLSAFFFGEPMFLRTSQHKKHPHFVNWPQNKVLVVRFLFIPINYPHFCTIGSASVLAVLATISMSEFKTLYLSATFVKFVKHLITMP